MIHIYPSREVYSLGPTPLHPEVEDGGDGDDKDGEGAGSTHGHIEGPQGCGHPFWPQVDGFIPRSKLFWGAEAGYRVCTSKMLQVSCTLVTL